MRSCEKNNSVIPRAFELIFSQYEVPVSTTNSEIFSSKALRMCEKSFFFGKTASAYPSENISSWSQNRPKSDAKCREKHIN